ncbi:Catechol 2,3-dioxygenase [Sinosporangium album]|uniref:Catechol 2,3-dioxygenase n=1 Tax=Sinosporangium album TaxID=504805 RepID=A0A1G8CZU0_9ACTN|nr:VOC family protein [Sinosporangium album]SDH51035.1 Catechol 2,3-dioxygenase [Sinosporangium album]
MPIHFNHTIVAAHKKEESARFLTDLFGLEPPFVFGPFLSVELGNGVTLDYADIPGEFPAQHYAFLVGDADFDTVFGRIRDKGLTYWADPYGEKEMEINHLDGGRGVYFHDPSGHNLEILTRPYGGGSGLTD